MPDFDAKAREIATTMRVEWANTAEEADSLTELVAQALRASYEAGRADAERDRCAALVRDTLNDKKGGHRD